MKMKKMFLYLKLNIRFCYVIYGQKLIFVFDDYRKFFFLVGVDLLVLGVGYIIKCNGMRKIMTDQIEI